MSLLFILIAFGFGNLAMLGWLAAVAAPLLIHLWSRHRYREAPWAAMQFLLAAMRKNARRLQLQQWLLLAVRMLIIALVVLAVAEPYGERLLAGLGGGPTHTILVIDGSYSMNYRDDDQSRFSRAKQMAIQLVRNSRSADTFTVILMAAPAKTILGREVVDHASVISQIEALTQSHTGADLPGALALADESIQTSATTSRTTRRQVFFLTDLQRVTWEHFRKPANVATGGSPVDVIPRVVTGEPRVTTVNLADRITTLAKQAELVVIDLGKAQATNTAITSLAASEPFITVGREVIFDANLRQFGSSSRPECAVELLVDGVPVSEQTVDLATGGDTAVRFRHRFQSPGEHSVEVRAPGDRLEIDNARWLIVPVREEVRILCVAGRPGAAKYVADALNPSPAGDSPLRPIIVSDGDLADVELTGFDCVFMCNVAQLAANEAERLRRYAQTGGGLVLFLGDRADRENYNSHAIGPEPWLPATLGEVVAQQQFGIDPLDYVHPIVAPFRGRERAGLLTTPIARYHQLELPKDRPNVQTAAAMPNGDPLIVTAPLGFGRIVLVATDGSLSSVDTASGEPWTNWPTWPSFLPIIRELLAYATSGKQQEWQQLVGTPLASRGVPAPDQKALNNLTSITLKIDRPDGTTAAVRLQSTPSGAEWTYNDTDLSGIYTLRGLPHNESPHSTSHESPGPQSPAPSPQLFAVNVETEESDLGQIDLQQLPVEFHLLNPANDSTQPGDTSSVSRAGWNSSLLWAALALILVESFLAWQFGRGAL